MLPRGGAVGGHGVLDGVSEVDQVLDVAGVLDAQQNELVVEHQDVDEQVELHRLEAVRSAVLEGRGLVLAAAGLDARSVERVDETLDLSEVTRSERVLNVSQNAFRVVAKGTQHEGRDHGAVCEVDLFDHEVGRVTLEQRGLGPGLRLGDGLQGLLGGQRLLPDRTEGHAQNLEHEVRALVVPAPQRTVGHEDLGVAVADDEVSNAGRDGACSDETNDEQGDDLSTVETAHGSPNLSGNSLQMLSAESCVIFTQK